jgi:hypothetical protein
LGIVSAPRVDCRDEANGRARKTRAAKGAPTMPHHDKQQDNKDAQSGRPVELDREQEQKDKDKMGQGQPRPDMPKPGQQPPPSQPQHQR